MSGGFIPARRPRSSPGRPRQPRTDRQIVEAARELLREGGPAAVNVATVAARSGVARTTIYRRYRDRTDLLASALEIVAARGTPPTDATVAQKLEWVLARTEEVLIDGIGPGGVGAVLTGSDPAFTDALREALATGLRPVVEQVEDDIRDGVLTPSLEADLLLDVLLGSYLAHRVRRGTPTPQWRRRTAEQLGALLGADPS